jgi:hypothetical protein
LYNYQEAIATALAAIAVKFYLDEEQKCY